MAGDRRGPPKGAKRVPRSGRKKGTPNKRTTELIEQARIDAENKAREVEIAKASDPRRGAIEGLRKKLAKDILEDYMMAFHAQAARFQPLPPGTDLEDAKRRGFEPSPLDFMTWGKLVVDTARALAEYQSPKYRAVTVFPAPELERRGDLRTIDEDGNQIIPRKDPVAAARVYALNIKRVVG